MYLEYSEKIIIEINDLTDKKYLDNDLVKLEFSAYKI